MIGLRDVDAVRQRQPDQLGVDQRHDAADFGDAEPGCDVIRPARHQQAHGIAGLDPGRQRPARIAVDPLGQSPVAEGFGFRDQGGAIGLPRGPILDDIGEQPLRIGLDARGQLNGLQPALGRGWFPPPAVGRLLDHALVHRCMPVPATMYSRAGPIRG